MASGSSSVLHAFEAEQRGEYPFPVVDTVEPPSSPSDSLPSTTHKSHRSDGTSSRHRRRYDRERDEDFTSASARLLARLASRDDRDIKHVRTLLVLTTERLDSETRRADQAEQRVIDTLHRLRAAHEATTASRAETARANETLQLYKLQLDYAQREIHRAQDILNQVENERAEAAAEAARARSTARRLREDNVITKAREQGRREGYQEGLSVGRSMMTAEGRVSPRAMNRRLPPRPTIDDEDEDVDDSPVRARSPARRTSSVFRISPPQSTYAPRPQLATNFDVRRPVTPARSSSRAAPPDNTAPYRDAPSLPMPTITTPMRIPSPYQAKFSPAPVPVLDPNSRQQPRAPSRAGRQSRSDSVSRPPVPIHEAPPSPSHPPYDMLPDNYIPLANDSRDIIMPPPHELSRPVTPTTPIPSLPETILPVAPSQETLVQAQSVRSRDFAYANRTNPSLPDSIRLRGAPGITMSPQSRTSTRISEFDILGPSVSRNRRTGGARSVRSNMGMYETGPSTSSLSLGAPAAPTRSRTPGPSVVDRPPSPRGPRSHSDPPLPSGPSERTEPEERRRTSSDNRGPLVQLFKKRFRSRTSPPDSGSGSGGLAVPDITVESPSTHASHSTEHANVPHLLSPDYAHSPLPTPEPSISMRQEPEALPVPPPGEVFSVLPPGFMPVPVPPPSSEGRNRRSSGVSRPTTPYAEAPLPSGVMYPEPPTGSMSALDDLYGTSPPGDGMIGGLSPLSIGKPLTFFPSYLTHPDDDDQRLRIS